MQHAGSGTPPTDGVERPSQSAESSYVGPRNPLEQLLVELWQEVLVVDRVGVRDDFFALGGDSLAAAAIISEVHDRLGLELTVKRLLECPTVEQTAVEIAAMLAERDAAPITRSSEPSTSQG